MDFDQGIEKLTNNQFYSSLNILGWYSLSNISKEYMQSIIEENGKNLDEFESDPIGFLNSNPGIFDLNEEHVNKLVNKSLLSYMNAVPLNPDFKNQLKELVENDTDDNYVTQLTFIKGGAAKFGFDYDQLKESLNRTPKDKRLMIYASKIQPYLTNQIESTLIPAIKNLYAKELIKEENREQMISYSAEKIKNRSDYEIDEDKANVAPLEKIAEIFSAAIEEGDINNSLKAKIENLNKPVEFIFSKNH